MVATVIKSESSDFFNYGVAYYNHRNKLVMWFTNDEDMLRGFLAKPAGAIKIVQTFQNQDEFKDFKARVSQHNNWQPEQNKKPGGL